MEEIGVTQGRSKGDLCRVPVTADLLCVPDMGEPRSLPSRCSAQEGPKLCVHSPPSLWFVLSGLCLCVCAQLSVGVAECIRVLLATLFS